MQHSPHNQEWFETLELLCFSSAGQLLEGISFAEFRARMVGMIDPLLNALGIPREMRPPTLEQAFATLVALEIWNATPLPDNRFRPRKLPRPQRNDPCLCGSGRKFKQCCGAAEPPALGITEQLMLSEVLRNLPKKILKTLPLDDLHPEALAIVASDWLDEGDAKNAVALLERLFERLPQLDARAEHAADVLLNAYADMHAPRKKQGFIDALKSAPDKTLRSTGWQRQAAIFCDRGNSAAAWEAFREAQRLTPNAPALSHLEVLLLVADNRYDEAKSRAQFWAARLARDPDDDHSDLIALLHDLADGSDAGALRSLQHTRSPQAALAGIVADWPAPACEYKLAHGEALHAKPALEEIETHWMDLREGLDDRTWLDFLSRAPLAGQSFLVLRDCVELLGALPDAMPGSNDALIRQLLERAEALRVNVLGKLKALNRELPWGFLDNRPLLTLVGYYADDFAASRPEETLNLLRWAVNIANPNDNQGLREILIHRLIAAGCAGEAVSVAERYPDDFASTQYGHALALYAAGRTTEAETVLRAAVEAYPKVWKMLHAANPKQPRLKGYGVTVGGDDEAWFYRASHLEVWRASGALRWSAGMSVAKPVAKKTVTVTSTEAGQASLPSLD